MNLLVSYYLPMSWLSLHQQFDLSRAVSLAIYEVLHLDYQFPVRIKWPNDILCEDQKIAGLLIQNQILGSQWRSSVLGIGLNINQLTFPAFDRPATSMALVLGQSLLIPEVFQRMNVRLTDRIYTLAKQPLSETRMAYEHTLWRRHAATQVRIGEHHRSAEIRGTTQDGKLILRFRDEPAERTFALHEITFL